MTAHAEIDPERAKDIAFLNAATFDELKDAIVALRQRGDVSCSLLQKPMDRDPSKWSDFALLLVVSRITVARRAKDVAG